MKADHAKLFQPLTIRHKTLKNRITFGAHTANMSIDGLPSERHLGYYRERARGGAGMIVVEPVPVHQTAVLTGRQFRAGDDAVIPHFRKITDTVHEYGTVIIGQMFHVGAHGDWDNSFEASWSPSGLPSMHDSDVSHAMTEAEIETTIDCFVAQALRAKASGFDGIEMMAAYNALIEQFWSPYSNRRDDKYGGSFANRMRFSETLLTRMRKAVGEDFIIGMAISVDDSQPDIMSIEMHQEVAAWHDERGLYDYVSCGTGGYYDFPRIIPTFLYEDKLGAQYAEKIRQVVKHVKVQAESHIRTPDNAAYIVSSGQADMVSIVRGQIADPHWANKAKDDRAEDIRPCISCNQMCWGRRSRDYWISCLVNPSSGREFQWEGDTFKPAEQPKKVLVIGGGPAGLEAARVAAERGHSVTLAEATDKLGGQFRLAGMQPRRQQILDLIDWYERQLQQHQVQIRYNSLMEADEIGDFAADAVIVATGSLPSATGFQRALPMVAQMPGIDRGNVWSAEDVMRREAKLGKRVIVIDEGSNWRGCGTAWHLAEKGHEVIMVTPATYIGQEIQRTSADWPLRSRLKKMGVVFRTEAVVSEWHGNGATITSILDNEAERIAADSLVLALANEANTALTDALRAGGIAHQVIGDSLAPRHAPAAILEGRRLGLAV
ncbi:FAD-dependent oxidoreductase [Dongia soli]|uniref:FAD-dependent oxidoreductase n=1 Tax=Dongia soli TaxID=600628 RepID=A0ABU5ECA8_9PROT|nr:FAD-dependent oxidoreductase [Dongia soli]MDY0883811.1 FAD-dependent oxidoreductase [Dongia soli]